MDGFTIGLLMLTGMALVPVVVAVVVLREGAKMARRHASLAEWARACGLSPGTPAGVTPADPPSTPFGSPVELAGVREGIRVGVRRVNGPLDDQGVGVQVWAEIPELGFGLSTSAQTVSGGPKVNFGDARFSRPLYVTGSGIAARASLDHEVRDALLPLTQAGRLALGVGRMIAVTRVSEPDGVRELAEWLDAVVAVARRMTERAARPIPERLAGIALGDPSREARVDAAEGLFRLGDRATAALGRLRESREPPVAVFGELAAGDVDALIARAEDSPEVIPRILEALEEAARGKGPSPLVARLEEPQGPLVRWLAGVVELGGSRGRAAEGVLELVRARLRPLAGRLSEVHEGGELALADSADAQGRVRLSE